MADDVSGTRIAEQLMSRPVGATMDEIVAATGGPQYNVLKKLEGRGYRIRRTREGRTTRYFVTPPEAPFYEATLTSKGQVTIPIEVREKLRLRAGQKLRFTLGPGDDAIVTAADARLSDLAGLLGKPKRSATVEEMDEAIREAAVARWRRAVGGKRR